MKADVCIVGCRKRRPASSLAAPLGGDEAPTRRQTDPPAAAGTPQHHGGNLNPGSAAVGMLADHSPHQLLPPLTAGGIRNSLGQGSRAGSSYQLRAGSSPVGRAGVAMPIPSASADAHGELLPMWPTVVGGTHHAMPNAALQTASQNTLADFCYPDLLAILQPGQPAAMHQLQHGLPALQLLPTIGLPALRMPAGQHGAFFLPNPHGGGMPATLPRPPLRSAGLQGSSGSADQRHALRGAALRQALRTDGPTPSSPVSGAGTRLPVQQQACEAGAASQSDAAAAQHQQGMQHQPMRHLPPLRHDPGQQQRQHLQRRQHLQQQQNSLPQQQRLLTPAAEPQHGQPEQSAYGSEHPMPSSRHRTPGGTAGTELRPAEQPDVYAAGATSNGTLSGSLKTPSSPAATSEVPGMEALRRRLRTNSDRCALLCFGGLVFRVCLLIS